MKLLLINPNTTDSMTRRLGDAARRAASSSTEVSAVQPGFGPRSIEGFYDEAVAAAGVAEQVRLRGADHDAVVIACFGDPGLDAAREAFEGPVLGIAEAAFHVASLLATRFSVVTTMTRTCVIAEHLLHRHGLASRCAGVHGTDIPVLDLDDGGHACLDRIEACAREALARDRSGALVLGCAGMAELCHTLQQRLGVPVVDGVSAAVRLAESLVALGLGTSKRGDYARPLPKAYTGWAAPLGW
jgi:allantoin racemase